MQRNRQLYRSNPNMNSGCSSILITYRCGAHTGNALMWNMFNTWGWVTRTISLFEQIFPPRMEMNLLTLLGEGTTSLLSPALTFVLMWEFSRFLHLIPRNICKMFSHYKEECQLNKLEGYAVLLRECFGFFFTEFMSQNDQFFCTFYVCIQTFHREYLTLPNPKSQEKNQLNQAESSRQQQTLKVSLRPLDGQSSSKRTLMVSLY